MYKILIIEDQILVKDMLIKEIEANRNIKVVASSDNANDMLLLCSKYKPDLVLSDIYTKNNSSGLDNAKILKKKYPGIKIILMTGVLELAAIKEAKKNGIDSFIYKTCSSSQLVCAINQTLDGYTLFPNPNDINSKAKILEDLTESEISVLELYCGGLDREEISQILGISMGTIKNKISLILSKTGFTSINKLIIYCINNQLIVPKNN